MNEKIVVGIIFTILITLSGCEKADVQGVIIPPSDMMTNVNPPDASDVKQDAGNQMDFTPPADLIPAADITPAADLWPNADMLPAADLLTPDMTSPPDIMPPIDLAPIPDLAPVVDSGENDGAEEGEDMSHADSDCEPIFSLASDSPGGMVCQTTAQIVIKLVVTLPTDKHNCKTEELLELPFQVYTTFALGEWKAYREPAQALLDNGTVENGGTFKFVPRVPLHVHPGQSAIIYVVMDTTSARSGDHLQVSLQAPVKWKEAGGAETYQTTDGLPVVGRVLAY